MLEELDLDNNNIGNTGCDALAALLADPNSNLRYLILRKIISIMKVQLQLQTV